MSKIKFVYFDLGNVLLAFSHQRACEQMAAVAEISPELVREVVFDGGLEDRYERGEISSDAFYDAFCTATHSRPERDLLLLASSDIFTLKYEMLPLVNGLHSAGTPLGILSNTCAAHWEFAIDGRFRILNTCFREYILSYEVQSMKPSSQIYSAAIAAAGVQPAEIFFTDDRLENVHAAQAAGMDAVQFTDSLQLNRELLKREIACNF